MSKVFTVGRQPIYSKEEIKIRKKESANRVYHEKHPEAKFTHHIKHRAIRGRLLTEEEKKQHRRDYNQKNKDAINAKRRENPNKKEYNKNYRATHVRNKLSDKIYNDSPKGKSTRKAYRESRVGLQKNKESNDRYNHSPKGIAKRKAYRKQYYAKNKA